MPDDLFSDTGPEANNQDAARFEDQLVAMSAELGWTITRGPLAVTGRAEGLTIVAPLNGTFRLTGQVGQQVGNLTNQLGGLLGDKSMLIGLDLGEVGLLHGGVISRHELKPGRRPPVSR